MSSPDGLRFSQAELLARWMPSSHRAGVILNPCPDLAASLRLSCGVGDYPMRSDDSMESDFAALPASADSSCLGADEGGEAAGGDRPPGSCLPVPGRNPGGQMESLGEMADGPRDVPLMMRLEQLRKWQQQMQEQLKAHQLEELLRLQEEQQRLLGMMNGSYHSAGEDYSGSSTLLGAEEEEEEDSLQRDSPHKENLSAAGINCSGIPPVSNCSLRQERKPPRVEGSRRGQSNELDNNHMDLWSDSDDEEERHFQEHDNTLTQSYGATLTEDQSKREDQSSQERPIKPGIGGHKQTFEELLEEQLRQEDQRLKSVQQNPSGAEATQAPPKRAFLKRGEGLSRFTSNHKASLVKKQAMKDSNPQPQARAMVRSNSEPAAIQRGGANCSQRPPIQRKTVILNKENRLKGLISPPQNIRAENATTRTVLGSYQRQNTEGSEAPQLGLDFRLTKQGQAKEQSNRKSGPHDVQPNPVTKEVGMWPRPGRTADNIAAKESSQGSAVESAAGGREKRGDRATTLDSIERSFQERLQRWEQQENMELGEFELLEQAAEELSFSSNSSFVMKVLHMDHQHRQLQATRGPCPRRLSSTPIKSPPTGEPKRCSSSTNPEAALVKMIDEEGRDVRREEELEKSDVSSSGGSEYGSEDQEMVMAPSAFPSNPCFPAQTEPLYDKWSYQDQDDCGVSDVTAGGDGESDSIVSNNDESTLLEDRGQGRVVFDDDDTWDDTVVTADDDSSRGVSPLVAQATARVVSPPVRTLLRKVVPCKAVELESGSADQEPEDLPPSSQLMTKLFPLLKPKVVTFSPPAPVAAAAAAVAESKRLEEETGQQIQSRQLRERLVQLELEIERFRKENDALARLRQENEKNQENLRKERLEFEQEKQQEMAKFEEYKKEEDKKLQKEKKLFEKHQAAARAIPDKKEREEIQALKQQLSSAQEELRRKESRWTSTQSRLRQQIDSLSHDNTCLRDEIRMLEKLRLSAWKKTPASAEREVKEGVRVMANTMPSVTKGVKFASPLDSRGGSIVPAHSSSSIPCRRRSAEIYHGMKSSLRRPSGPCLPSSSSSSSSQFSRRSEERSPPADKIQENTDDQEVVKKSCSPIRDSPHREVECSTTEEAEESQEVVTHPDVKTEQILPGGDRLIVFANGTKKEVSADGLTVKVTFFNGDTKQVTADQRVIYYYSEARTTHITYPDGLEVLHFANNQTEKLFPDGRKEITFPDQTVKKLFPDGREESVLMDGTVVQVHPDGTKEIHFNTGQKEIHTSEFKKREYPDGTVKTVYADGRQETRYPTGRLRIKDKEGNVVMDDMA